MYDRIIAHKSGSLEIPGASKECNDFVNKLMHQYEKKRMTAAKVSGWVGGWVRGWVCMWVGGWVGGWVVGGYVGGR